MNGPNISRQELEDIWSERVNVARRLYKIAKLEASQAAVRIRNGDLPLADGHFAFRKALRQEADALIEYQRVLKIFNALVLDGTRPDPDA